MRRIRSFLRDKRGAHLAEFAVVLPVMLMMIMGILELGYRQYAIAMLQGAMQKAARDGTLEGGAAAENIIDKRVRDNFKVTNAALKDNDFRFTRRNFMNFTGSNRTLEDSTGPGNKCVSPLSGVTRTYFDMNNNSLWDDGAQAGQGGAQDVVMYTAYVTYDSLFPVGALIGMPAKTTVSSSIVLRNQPFDIQGTRAAGTDRNCPNYHPQYAAPYYAATQS